MRLRHGQIATERPGGTTLVRGKCTFTDQSHEVIVPTDGLDRWLCGALIQDAMPNVSADDREFLISGISPKGWEETFSDEYENL